MESKKQPSSGKGDKFRPTDLLRFSKNYSEVNWGKKDIDYKRKKIYSSTIEKDNHEQFVI